MPIRRAVFPRDSRRSSSCVSPRTTPTAAVPNPATAPSAMFVGVTKPASCEPTDRKPVDIPAPNTRLNPSPALLIAENLAATDPSCPGSTERTPESSLNFSPCLPASSTASAVFPASIVAFANRFACRSSSLLNRSFVSTPACSRSRARAIASSNRSWALRLAARIAAASDWRRDCTRFASAVAAASRRLASSTAWA